jgi:hypothetical protein
MILDEEVFALILAVSIIVSALGIVLTLKTIESRALHSYWTAE